MKKENDIKNELTEISRTVSDIPSDNPYAANIPAGYFEQLSGKIISRIQEEEKDELTESLKSVQHINVYQVNENYFSNLNQTINKQIDANVKVISIKKRTATIRYLAAAVIIGILGFGLVNLYLNYKENAARKAESELAIKEAKEILHKGTLNQELNALNEEDISAYLAMNGNDLHASLVASSIDEEYLPEAEEYIYNNNTLNDFLNELNISEKMQKNN